MRAWWSQGRFDCDLLHCFVDETSLSTAVVPKEDTGLGVQKEGGMR